MIDELSQEVGCDECSISTADCEDDAQVCGWLVDARMALHRHVCPICLAVTEHPPARGEAQLERRAVDLTAFARRRAARGSSTFRRALRPSFAGLTTRRRDRAPHP
jgi:hypothetical protein